MKSHVSGMVTIPFLLVSVILLYLILSFFFLNMTFVHISVTQYMSYSTARKLALGNESLDKQYEVAQDHYKKLREKFFNKAYTKNDHSEWFFITEELKENKIGSSVYGMYPQINIERERFYGINLLFQNFVLRLNIPFLSQGSDTSDLQTRVSSFLGREASEQECKIFMKKKSQQLAKQCPNSMCHNIREAIGGDPDNGC